MDIQLHLCLRLDLHVTPLLSSSSYSVLSTAGYPIRHRALYKAIAVDQETPLLFASTGFRYQNMSRYSRVSTVGRCLPKVSR